MDEHLLNIVEDGQVDSTVEFFRQYMAGFMISRHETSTSVCGSNYERGTTDNGTADTSDLLCMMYGATQTVRGEEFFRNTVDRQMYARSLPRACYIVIDADRDVRRVTYSSALGCSLGSLNEEYMDALEYPICDDVMFDLTQNPSMNETTISFMLDSTMTNLTDLLRQPYVFQVDGGVRDVASSDAFAGGGSTNMFGRRHAEIGLLDEMGATIFYNNQVINFEALINSVCIGIYHWTNVCVHTCICMYIYSMYDTVMYYFSLHYCVVSNIYICCI